MCDGQVVADTTSKVVLLDLLPPADCDTLQDEQCCDEHSNTSAAR